MATLSGEDNGDPHHVSNSLSRKRRREQRAEARCKAAEDAANDDLKTIKEVESNEQPKIAVKARGVAKTEEARNKVPENLIDSAESPALKD